MNWEWLLSLKIDDRIDVFEEQYNDWGITEDTSKWYACRVNDIQKQPNHCNEFKVSIQYEKMNYSKWITIKQYPQTTGKMIIKAYSDRSSTFQKILKPLHTMTPYHYGGTVCQFQYNGWPVYANKYATCNICHKPCCQCYVVSIYILNKLQYQCKECFFKSRYQHLFGIIYLTYQSIFRYKSVEIQIITMITNFSFEKRIKCENKVKHCHNSIKLHLITQKMLFNCNVSLRQYMPSQHLVSVCNDCSWNQKYNKKTEKSCLNYVFHQNMQFCDGGCSDKICVNCTRNKCGGIKCEGGNYCYGCTIKWGKCQKCQKTYLCAVCYQTSNCHQCGDQICINNKCKRKCKVCCNMFCNKCFCNDKCGNKFCAEICAICCGKVRKCDGCKDNVCNKCGIINKCNQCKSQIILCSECMQPWISNTFINDQKMYCDQCDSDDDSQ